MFAYVVQAWLPMCVCLSRPPDAFFQCLTGAAPFLFFRLIFPQVEQPRVFKGNVTTACINLGMMSFAMLTLYLSKRDQRRARKRRASAVPSEASDDYVAEDETHVDIKKAKTQAHASDDVSEVPVPTLTSEFRCAASIA
uniref:N/A n=1 Tax=Ganoderma boninense TaxID=34458 RepID=A0A5K1JVA2_9APHY|nr:N/A [Ganoderma boninense]